MQRIVYYYITMHAGIINFTSVKFGILMMLLQQEGVLDYMNDGVS